MVTPLHRVENLNTRRIYFTSEDDLHLLREVVGQNPYEDNNRWNIIQNNLFQILGKFISVRALKDRVRNLVNKFVEKDRTLQFQSGIEEEITELDDLLRHILDLINEFKNKKPMECKKVLGKTPLKASKKIRNDTSYQKGLLQRTLATNVCTVPEASTSSTEAFSTHTQYEIFEEDPNVDLDNSCNEIEMTNGQEYNLPTTKETTVDFDSNENRGKSGVNNNRESSKKSTPSARNILTPTRKRAASSLKQSTLAYLTKKNERWYEIRSRELALQEREKSLQEAKFELENWERRKRIEMEEKKLTIELDIYKNQQKLIEIALQRN